MEKQENVEWFDEFNSATVEIAKIGKRTRCEIERGPSDNSPFLIWQGWGKDDTHIVPLKHHKNSAVMLRNTFSETLTGFHRPRYVGVVVEAYVKTVKTDEELKNVQHGQLQENFLNNYDPSIKEVISIICFDFKGHILVNITGYKYDDAGQPDFEATETTVADYGLDETWDHNEGLTISAIKEFVAFSNSSNDKW